MSPTTLRKIAENELEEISSTASGESPVIWQRDFNSVGFPLTDIKLHVDHNIHGQRPDPERMESTDPGQYDASGLPVFEVTGHKAYRLEATVDDERMEDTVLCLVGFDEDKQTYKAEEYQGKIIVELRPGDPAEEDEVQGAGVFVGGGFRGNPVHGTDDLCFDLRIPGDHFRKIIKVLERDETSELRFFVYLDSYMRKGTDDWFEDALRTANLKPKCCLMEDTAKCLVRGITITKSLANA